MDMAGCFVNLPLVYSRGDVYLVCYYRYMSEDQFTKLFKYMEKRFNDVDKRFDMQDAKISELSVAVADLGGQIRD